MIIPTEREFVTKALKDCILEMLELCNEGEKAFFHRIHASAPWKTFEACPSDEVPGYYALVRRTLLAKEPK